MSRRLDATTALLTVIRERFGTFAFALERVKSRAWASATFTGARHELSFHLSGDGAAAAADQFLGSLAAAEFRLKHHILADIALVSDERCGETGEVRIALEALTVEDL